MAQYLLSVYQPVGPAPAPEFLEPIMRDLEALNREMQAAGAWVFAAGLHPAESATVVRQQGAEVLITDGPFAEGEGAPRRVHRHRGGRPRRRPWLGRQAGPRHHPSHRSATHPALGRREWSAQPCPARPARRSLPAAEPGGGHRPRLSAGIRACGGRPDPHAREHRRRRGRRPGCVHPRRPALAVIRHPAKPGRLDHHHGPEPGRSTGCAGKPDAGTSSSRPRSCRRPARRPSPTPEDTRDR